MLQSIVNKSTYTIDIWCLGGKSMCFWSIQRVKSHFYGIVKWLGQMLGCVVEAHNLGFDYLVLVVASMVSTSRFVSPWKIRWARPWKVPWF